MRVVLIDDHTLFRSGLEHLLVRRGIEVAAATSDSGQAQAIIEAACPDIVLLDIRMPKVSGLETIGILRKAGIMIPIVMLTTSSDEADLVASLQGGAQGYLLKDMEPDDLVAALTDVMAGKMVVAPEFSAVLARFIQRGPQIPPVPSAFSELTPREQEILRHLADGQSNKTIGRALGISDGTVKLHVKSILRKLQLHSRVQAAVRSVEEGFGRKG
ncbi:MAG: response regulator [Acidiferrobacter sp.]